MPWTVIGCFSGAFLVSFAAGWFIGSGVGRLTCPAGRGGDAAGTSAGTGRPTSSADRDFRSGSKISRVIPAGTITTRLSGRTAAVSRGVSFCLRHDSNQCDSLQKSMWL